MGKIIAITGRSGSGKSEVSRYLRSLGFTVIDADEISREVLISDKNVQCALVDRFGNIKNADGTISPVKLAQKAFSNTENAKALSEITHPAIIRAILDIVKNSQQEIVFVDGAVIIGELFEQYCDRIIVITAPYESSIARITARDGITEQAAIKRLEAQLNENLLLAKADFIIVNDASYEQLIYKVQQILPSVTKELHD